MYALYFSQLLILLHSFCKFLEGVTGIPCSCGSNAYNPDNDSLRKPDSDSNDSEAKLSDGTIKAIWNAGAKETLWVNLEVSGGRYVKFKWNSAMVNAWSSNFHWSNRPGGVFQHFYVYSANFWAGANGHTNNWHFSNYNDGGSGLSGFSSWEDNAGDSAYWATRGDCLCDNRDWKFKMYAS